MTGIMGLFLKPKSSGPYFPFIVFFLVSWFPPLFCYLLVLSLTTGNLWPSGDGD